MTFHTLKQLESFNRLIYAHRKSDTVEAPNNSRLPLATPGPDPACRAARAPTSRLARRLRRPLLRRAPRPLYSQAHSVARPPAQVFAARERSHGVHLMRRPALCPTARVERGGCDGHHPCHALALLPVLRPRANPKCSHSMHAPPPCSHGSAMVSSSRAPQAACMRAAAPLPWRRDRPLLKRVARLPARAWRALPAGCGRPGANTPRRPPLTQPHRCAPAPSLQRPQRLTSCACRPG